MNRFRRCIVLVISLCFPIKAWPAIISSPRPIQGTIASSQVIVVAKIKNFIADKTFHNPAIPPMNDSTTAPGLYSFETMEKVKGKSLVDFQLGLPEVLPFYYGGARLQVKEGSIVLLLLKSTLQGLSPADATLPLIPLAPSQGIGEEGIEEVSAQPLLRVIHLLAGSFVDSALRQSSSFLLRGISAPQIVTELAPFLNDPNLRVQNNVLYAMATNQQLAAIPYI